MQGLVCDMANTTLYYSKSTKNADVSYILELTNLYSRDISGAIKAVYELYMKREALKSSAGSYTKDYPCRRYIHSSKQRKAGAHIRTRSE